MERFKKPLVISCGILRKEIEHLQRKGDIDVEAYFLSEKLHMDYNLLDRGLNCALKKHQKKSHRGIVVVYGDLCLGFNDEMKTLISKYDAVKVDALNCIDCLLGGKGNLLNLDPDHKILFLNPAFIEFGEKIREETKEWTRETYSMLDGIVLLDALGDLDDYQSKIDEIVERTGLPIIDRMDATFILPKHLSSQSQSERFWPDKSSRINTLNFKNYCQAN
ncbi:putative protein DUF1638 [Desulfosarcina variabilis str. Montpellier]|uniref:DUF1638 domain-containing protein n=1 Tax=Desulfosarcina variabilis TaxID=2300 RepID=UPI003AFAE79B